MTIYACHTLEQRRKPLESTFIAPTVPAAISRLKESGVAVVEGLRIDDNLISNVMKIPAAEGMPNRKIKPRRRGQKATKEEEDRESKWRVSALGRYHCRDPENFAKPDMEVLAAVESKIYPVVKEFFSLTDEKMGGVYRSELQLMTAVPGSVHQAWHKDNRARGLSVIVPLVDFTEENGGTQLLLGSHESPCPIGPSEGARTVGK